MNFIWNIVVFGLLSCVVQGSNIKTKLKELLEENLDSSDAGGKNATICHLKQTMAWNVCGRYSNCPTSCKGPDDCTFPYCDSRGLCTCRNTFCVEDHMCNFFRIACKTKFVCRQGGCICESEEADVASLDKD